MQTGVTCDVWNVGAASFWILNIPGLFSQRSFRDF